MSANAVLHNTSLVDVPCEVLKEAVTEPNDEKRAGEVEKEIFEGIPRSVIDEHRFDAEVV